MFTGLVEEVSKIQVLAHNNSGARLFLIANKILNDTKIGDSICINGVCLTVTKIHNNQLEFDISKETLNISTFSTLKAGDIINLERAMSASSRFGGHIVSGHVDCIGKIASIKFDGMSYIFGFEIDDNFSKYLIKKGSICINGISLTIKDIKNNHFETAIIPHTFQNTNLSSLKENDKVNIEIDMMAKYIEKYVENSFKSKHNSTITESFLKEHGF